MSKHLVTYKNLEFKIESDGDHYGQEFWTTLQNRLWEPDTLDFLEREITPETILFDIGAANGSMSLIGASLGAQVIAYEPNPTVHQVCKINIELNPLLGKLINLKLAAVSNVAGNLTFEFGRNSAVITDISVGIHEDKETLIPILSLKSELENLADSRKKILIKMDIEGAEFAILHDQLSLKAMSDCRAKLLLAIHPGFYRPIRNSKILRGFRSKIFILRNFLEAVRLFSEISEYAKVYRTNLNPVKSSRIFGLLVVAGYHEFIMDFNAR
jgi:FkbM family methyltransferase